MGFLDRAKKKIGSLTDETIALGKMDKEPEPEAKPAKESRPRRQETLFAGDDQSEGFFAKLQARQDRQQAERERRYGDMAKPEATDGAIQDVLSLLGIPATFEIKHDVFMPDDVDKVKFDLEVPQGYERAEVDSFKKQTKRSIEHFVSLLRQRNDHIARLATTVDRLQVDLNNLKWQAEVADGISVIPTNDQIDLENENDELRLQIASLQQQLRIQGEPLADNVEIQRLKDTIVGLEREMRDLQAENRSLLNQVRVAEENSDREDSDYDDYSEQESAFMLDNAGDSSLDEIATLGDEKAFTGSAFAAPKESLAEFAQQHSEAFDDDDDDDDELEQLMRTI